MMKITPTRIFQLQFLHTNLDPVYSTDLSTGMGGDEISINDWNESIIGSPGDNTGLGCLCLNRFIISSVAKQRLCQFFAGESNEPNLVLQ